MKLVLPVAGRGTRMRPITYTTPKPLIPIAGKPVVQRIIEQIQATQGLEIDEIIFITGHLGEQIEEWAKDTFDCPMRFIEQKVKNGTADAIRLAEPHVDKDMLVIFADTLFDADFEVIVEDKDVDGIIWVAEVEDARRFGVVAHDEDNFMTELIEKPDNPPSNLVNIGMYYVRDTESCFGMIEALYEHEIKTKGEYNFPEALDLMAKNGKKLRVTPVEGWYDAGVPATTLATHKLYCKREGATGIHKTAVIEESKLDNCIVLAGARIHNSKLKDSIIGKNAVVKDMEGSIIIGDNSRVEGN